MPFRVVAIEHPAEVHVTNSQLVVQTEEGIANIPVKDIYMLVTLGADIRMSSMAQTILADNNVVTVLMGTNHLPSAMILPMVANARQAKVSYAQIATTQSFKNRLWSKVVTKKIENQARALALLGLEGVDEVMQYSLSVKSGDSTFCEASAAKVYFQYLHPGLNRRTDDPFNSCLNYGYAVVRAAVARALVTTGFIPAFGIHHQSQLNPFNLADDFIEPFRPCVDVLASRVVSTSIRLTREQRVCLREVLQMAVLYKKRAIPLIEAIDRMCDSLESAVANRDIKRLELPTLSTDEILPLVKE